MVLRARKQQQGAQCKVGGSDSLRKIMQFFYKKKLWYTLKLILTSVCWQYFALHQLVDWRDLVEPVMPEDWDKYFPDGIRNQYCMPVTQDQAMG